MKIKIMIATLFVSMLAFAGSEIQHSDTLTASKGNAQIQWRPNTASIDWNGTRFFDVVVSCTTSWQALSKGSVVTNGVFLVWNQSTNINEYLSFNSGTTTNILIKPGEFFSFRLDPMYNITTLQYKAASGTPDLRTTILED